MEKLEVVNQVLQSFAQETSVERRRGGWYVCWDNYYGDRYERRWQCRGQDTYPVWYRSWAHGGTACNALSQLIRWLRGQPVVPIGTWKYWTTDRVKLIDDQGVIQLLLDNGYPEEVNCVLCGRLLTNTFDWWSLNKVSGPCCFFPYGCQKA